MSQSLIRRVTSSSAEDTEALAQIVGRHLKGGETVELGSDLGGGKTTFVRGLARGFGSTDRVASPTFTISKVYKSGQQTMHHFDFYRLEEGGLTGHELAEVIGESDCVVVVEWAKAVEDVLPADRLSVTIERVGEDPNSEEKRRLTLHCPADLAYLVEGIK